MERCFSFLRNLGLLITVMFFALWGAEYFWRWYSDWYLPPQIMQHGNLTSMFEQDETFGYKAVPFATVQTKKTIRSQSVYDVTYHMDEFGWRNEGVFQATDNVWLFLGDSFTFGEGLMDDQTLSMRFAEQAQGHYAAYQLAAPGYGPHQLLRMLETETPLLYAGSYHTMVYQALPDHLFRFKGIYGWDSYGPEYVIKDDQAQYVGHFHSKWASATLNVFRVFSKLAFDGDTMISSAERTWLKHRDKTITEYGAMVAGIQKLAADKYQARLVVVLWDNPPLPYLQDWSELAGKMQVELNRRGIQVIKVSKILGSDLTPYVIAEDGHPNAAANQKIAAALLELSGS